mgnify:CR=1 FL=1
MDNKIKIYESLLNEKAALEKECFECSLEYARKFGDEIQSLFELKVEAVTLKKKISFCVKKQYVSEKIYAFELDRYIDEEILEYQKRLQVLIEYNNAARENKGEPLTFEDVKKIKKLYYEIAHLIHPDLHPEYKNDEEMLGLWNKAVSAYKCNDYKLLVEAYDQIIIKVKDSDVCIKDIDSKIEVIQDEIENIKENEPYTYKFLLDSDIEINEFHQKLELEIKDYQKYISSLKKELNKFDIVLEGCEA